jgi:hypothetical protein
MVRAVVVDTEGTDLVVSPRELLPRTDLVAAPPVSAGASRLGAAARESG